MSLPIVAIVGITGTQGESVAKALLATRGYVVRGLTRNPSSDAATALKAQGAEIVAADLDDGVAALSKVFLGVWAVYAYTVPGQKEVEHGKAIVDAALQVGVERIIWSSSIDSTAISKGKWIIPLNDSKVEVERYISSTSLRATFINLGGFCENLSKYHWLNAGHNTESLALTVPVYPADAEVAWTWAGRDLGEAVRVILKDAKETDGKHVDGRAFDVSRERISFERFREIIEEVSGLPTAYRTLSREQVLSFNPGLGELCDLLEFWIEFPMADVQVPDPGLVSLGAQFGDVKDWAQEELSPLLKAIRANSQK